MKRNFGFSSPVDVPVWHPPCLMLIICLALGCAAWFVLAMVIL